MPRDVRAALAAGRGVYGSFLNAGSLVVADLLAACGYDCLMIDGEHSPVGFETAQAMAIAVQGRGVAALMRIAANDPVMVKRALDIGIDGIMIPAISSRAEAEAAVRAFRFPPEGVRGVAVPVVRASEYGVHTEHYLAEGRHKTLLICQIETRAGVEAIEEIVAVDGIDMLFVGPYDLSANLGYLGQPDHPEARTAIAHVEQVARRAGRWLGTIETAARPAPALFADGFQMVLGSADLGMLRESALRRISVARGGAAAG
ncbi:MAG: aldolase/citrate lyase family protein [Rhodospirillaceae bacterium]|nr:aldolase/citrate lyase family protein [Rhodospirillaceae bacterium]